MVYIVPQALIYQELQAAPAALINPQPAFLAGPNAQLFRYSEEDERAQIELGFYDPLLGGAYTWPGRPAGSIVDQDSVVLVAENALLKYFEDLIGADSAITKLAGYKNRIISDSVNFVDDDDFPRDAALYDRDVKVGDVAKVRAVVGADEFILWTYVAAIAGVAVAATVDTAEADVDNAGAQVASSSAVQTVGPYNCVTATPDESAYDGLADGDINETYTIIVTESSVGGDLTTAKLRILSASGNDDDDDVSPAAAGNPTDIGSRGLTVTFDLDTGACSTSASDQEVSSEDLLAGQRWEVSVSQAFTVPTATEGGTYTGETDTTYKITVTRGGLYAGGTKPQITISTTTGVDNSGPHNVTSTSAVSIGNYGLTVAFDGTYLRKGDIYYIAVTAPTDGALRTLVLGHNLSEDIPDDTEVDLTLYINKSSVEIPKNREGFAPITNYETSATEITVSDAIVLYDETWTDGGTQLPLELVAEEDEGYTDLFVEYRAWLSDLCGEVNGITDVGDIDDIPGQLHPDNTLKYNVYKALQNANGREVMYMAVCDPDDTDEWIAVIDKIEARDDVYELVPLTHNATVLGLFQAHCAAASAAEAGLWRVMWTALEDVAVKAIATAEEAGGDNIMATLADDPDTSGTQYTRLQITSGNIDLIEAGVQAGDTVRYLFTSDGFGGTTYTEFTVDAVLTEDEVRLVTGHSAAVNVAEKVEFHRTLSATARAAAIGDAAAVWADRRVRAVWPDTIEGDGYTLDGLTVCSALAGLTSGALPHQSMTRAQLLGFTSVPRTDKDFSKSQLDAMAEKGVWLVTQLKTGQIVTRHGLTTGDQTDLNQKEEMITRNLDNISYRFKAAYEPFIGSANVVDAVAEQIQTVGDSLIEQLKSENYNERLGGQVVDGQIREVRKHRLFGDRFIVITDLELPKALNNIENHLIVV